jgi:DNA polymerase elongation subunit (family B)
MNNYVAYIDTDSVFIMLNQFLINQGVDIDKWNALDRDIKVKYLLKLSKEIETHVNNKSYNQTQLIDYNSTIEQDDFSIKLKQEIVCSNALFLAPKMYAFHVINEEGYDTDDVSAKGIEIVRSSAPTVFRNALKEILELLLKGHSDEELSEKVDKYKQMFYKAKPEDISVNTGVNGIDKYITEFEYGSGTPYHIKGIAHYHFLLDQFGISNKYSHIKEGDKCKVVYLLPNKYNVPNITYYKYPKEFIDNGIKIDYDTMIEKYFMNKARIILDPINRSNILEDKGVEDVFF